MLVRDRAKARKASAMTKSERKRELLTRLARCRSLQRDHRSEATITQLRQLQIKLELELEALDARRSKVAA